MLDEPQPNKTKFWKGPKLYSSKIVLNEFNQMNVRMRKAYEDIGKCLHADQGHLNWGHDSRGTKMEKAPN